MIAPFNALAGPSPNCDAVLVQIEHCAKVKSEREKVNNIIRNNFFIIIISTPKIIGISKIYLPFFFNEII